jgi:hypothetical protein
MFNLDTLDTVIAIIVVLLVLSLLVQAIQSFVKKVFKLKSKEIEKSLIQLFENVIDKPNAAAPPAASTPAVSSLASPPAANAEPITSQALAMRVLEEFKNIGRHSRWGGTVLDSISKEDLLKILAKIDSKHFYADYVRKFQDMYTDIQALEQEINRLINNDPPLLQGTASARFAEMQQVLTPLVNDVKTLVAGNAIKSDIIFGDLMNLRQVKLDEALKLLAAAQDSIAEDLKAERTAQNTLTVAALQQLSASLAKIAGILGQLSQRMDAAFTALRAKLDHVERWYDTVMQSFEERYARNMKTVALYISIVVVVYLNASFFRIYHSIATSDIHRALIVQEGENLANEDQKKPANQNANRAGGGSANNTGSTPVDNNGGSVNSNNGGSSLNINASAQTNNNTGGNINPGNTNTGVAPASTANTNLNAQPTPTPAAATTDNNLDELDEQRKVIEDYVDTYEGFGFSPLTWQQVKIWAKSVFGSEVIRDESGTLINKHGDPILANCEPTDAQDCKQASVSEDGTPLNKNGDPIAVGCKPAKAQDCEPVYRHLAPGEWWADRKQDFNTLVGWGVMVLLLGVGAPFWQDTLESLFGVKNLLRKRSDTKNVEKESGAGQPRQ